MDRNFLRIAASHSGIGSLSARRAWIEIFPWAAASSEASVALRKESVDRNILQVVVGAAFQNVALRKESVDRNSNQHSRRATCCRVALRKESVDRNTLSAISRIHVLVALRKESVDRNAYHAICLLSTNTSLSARRAWIEILRGCWFCVKLLLSLSARRAWIEILYCTIKLQGGALSLSARRAWIEIFVSCRHVCRLERRSPQGERG